MSQFPQALFRMPGDEQLELGGFTTVMVHDAEDRDAKLADGFHATQDEAKAAHDESVKGSVNSGSVGDPPKREELEQKATELGLKFDKRTSDAKLAAAIEAKLKDAA